MVLETCYNCIHVADKPSTTPFEHSWLPAGLLLLDWKLVLEIAYNCIHVADNPWASSYQHSWLPAGLHWTAAAFAQQGPCCHAGSDLHAVCLAQLFHEWLQLIQLVIHAL